jgi:ubiquinone/menaquinone biosynthesis C-methylase UbiE
MRNPYSTHVLPRLINLTLNRPHHRQVRARLGAQLKGDVVELGFGTGLNVPHYGPDVTAVTAIEPSDVAWKLAAERVKASRVPVVRAGLDGQHLPLPDRSADTVLSTWTLCTIPDVSAALAEVRRVLRPGGRLVFVEHGLAPDPGVQQWQHRMNPLQRRVAGGCHLDRDIAGLLADAGLKAEHLDTAYAPGEPKLFGYLYEGWTGPIAG